MKRLTQKAVLLAIVVAVLFDSSTQATSHKRDLTHNRQKRSFSWMPFFGSGSSSSNSGKNSEDDDLDNETEDPSDVYIDTADQNTLPVLNRLPNGDIVVNDQIPAASVIESLVKQGHVVNNQLHYPIWRVHKYNGIHLRPLPVSLVAETDARYTQSEPEQNALFAQHRLPNQPSSVEIGEQVNSHASDEQLQNHLTPQNAANAQDYPPELIALARQFGITDLSKFPSLDEAMNLLGTTTQEETIKTIKEIATTEDGRNLIRQFIGGGTGSTDNEEAASPLDENIEDASTNLINQYLLPSEIQTEGLQQIPFDGEQEDTEEQQESDQSEDSTDTTENEDAAPANASIFSRISQWANFLNPLAGREEIPIPPNYVEDESNENTSDAAEDGTQLNRNDYILNENTVPIPNLPELPTLPEIPGVNHDVPELPSIHIPRKYVTRAIGGPNVPAQRTQSGGTYVRVRLPLAGFNPTPQIAIDPKYLYYYYNQLARRNQQLRVQQPQQFKVQQPQQFRVQQSQQLRAQQLQQSQHPQQLRIPQPQSTQAQNPESHPVQSIHPNLTPASHPDPRKTQPQIAHNYELPLHQAKHVFRTEHNTAQPQIQSAVHHEQPPPHLLPPKVSNSLPVSFATPFRSQATHVGQLPLIRDANYEVFKNAPRIVTSYGTPALPYSYALDQTVNTFRSPSSGFIHQEYELRPAASETVETEQRNSDSQEIEGIDKRTDNEDLAAAPNHEIKTDKISKSIVKETNATKETETVSSASVKQHDRHTNLNSVVAESKDDAQNRSSNIQRITSYDTFATGKLHKADPKAIELLPFTVRHMLENDTQSDEKRQ